MFTAWSSGPGSNTKSPIVSDIVIGLPVIAGFRLGS